MLYPTSEITGTVIKIDFGIQSPLETNLCSFNAIFGITTK